MDNEPYPINTEHRCFTLGLGNEKTQRHPLVYATST